MYVGVYRCVCVHLHLHIHLNKKHTRVQVSKNYSSILSHMEILRANTTQQTKLLKIICVENVGKNKIIFKENL